jgi:hypothetical protein
VTVPVAETDSVAVIEKRAQDGLRRQGVTGEEGSLEEACDGLIRLGHEVYFFVIFPRVLTHAVCEFVGRLNTLIKLQSRVAATIFIEADVARKPYVELLKANHKLIQNVYYLPVYSLEEARHFVKRVAKDWQVRINPQLVEQIVEECGGFLWLLREAVRLIRDGKDLSQVRSGEYPGMKMRLEYIAGLLTKREKAALLAMINRGEREVVEPIRNYLVYTGLVIAKGKKWALACPLLKPYLEKAIKVGNVFKDERGQIWFGEQLVDATLTAKELVMMRTLLTYRGQIVSRDDLAKAVWGFNWEEEYSDWALDQVVSRLRKALEKLGLPKEIIITKKGQGWLVR